MSIDLNRILRNFFSVSVMRIGTAFLSFVLFTILARYWGVEPLGQFSTLFAYFMLILQLPLLGLHIPLSRYIATDEASVTERFINALVITFPISVVLCIAMGLIGKYAYEECLHAAFWLVGLSAFPMGIIVAIEAVLTGKQTMSVIAWVNMVETSTRVVVCLLLVALGFELPAIFTIFLLSKCLSVLLYWRLARIAQYLDWSKIKASSISGYLSQVPTFLGILVLSVGMGRLDFIFLSLLDDMQAVGMYSPSFKVYEIGLMVPSVLATVMFPVFSRLYSGSFQEFDNVYQLMSKLVLVIGLPMIIGVAVLAKQIITVLFGADYVESSMVLQILSVVILIIALDQVMAVVLFAANKEKHELGLLVVSFILYVSLLLYFIHSMSYLGAALATLVAVSIKLVIRYFMTTSVLNTSHTWALMIKPALSAVMMLVVLWQLISINIVLAFVLAVGAYILCLWGLRVFSSADLLRLTASLKGSNSVGA